jgi:hypothetical protein
VDITVGNGTADTCPGGGTANAMVVIPVQTRTWLAGDFSCPDADGVFNSPGDTPILLISQNLDFTTDVTTSNWTDIDGDGCSIAGAGPAARSASANVIAPATRILDVDGAARRQRFIGFSSAQRRRRGEPEW